MKACTPLVVLVFVAGSLAAQGPKPTGLPRLPAQPAAYQRSERQPAERIDSVAQTHWKEGMIIGGIVGAVIGEAANSFEHAISENSSRGFNYQTFFISTALFAIIGG